MYATYETLVENARRQSSSLNRYAAVVETVCYLQSGSRQTVMVSSTPIRSRQRGNTFVGVMCQFRNGMPCPVQ